MFAGFAQAEIVPLNRARCLRRGSKSKSRRFCSAASRPNVENAGGFSIVPQTRRAASSLQGRYRSPDTP
jgi:hypothetical protein